MKAWIRWHDEVDTTVGEIRQVELRKVMNNIYRVPMTRSVVTKAGLLTGWMLVNRKGRVIYRHHWNSRFLASRTYAFGQTLAVSTTNVHLIDEPPHPDPEQGAPPAGAEAVESV